jgi:hypothetical protein
MTFHFLTWQKVGVASLLPDSYVAHDALRFEVPGGPAGGNIATIKDTLKNELYAVCPNKAHGRCVLTRTCMAKPTPRTPAGRAQGRPFGLLCGWLSMAYSDKCPTKDDHMMFARTLSLEERREARAAIKLVPGSDFALAVERPKRAGSDSEPDECP